MPAINSYTQRQAMSQTQCRTRSLAQLQRLKDVLMGYTVYPRRSRIEHQLSSQHSEWAQHPNVLGIGIDNTIGDDSFFNVYLQNNRATTAPLSIPPAVNTFNMGWIETKILNINPPTAQGFSSIERPIRPGASISHINDEAGTASLCVRKRVDSHLFRRYLLSCEHVLYGDFNSSSESAVVQPARADSYTSSDLEIVASRFERGRLFENGVNEIDAAIAELAPDVEMTNQPLANSFTINAISNFFNTGSKVIMIGRTSGQTEGEVLDISANVALNYKTGLGRSRPLRFRNLVRCSYDNRGGDSGAPVLLADTKQLIGLHIAGDSHHSGYFCRIDKVFSTLQIGLP